MMIDQPGDPGKPSTYKPRHNEANLYDAAWNAVAIAATHWQQSSAALSYTLSRGQLHGLTVLELCAASGLDEITVERMIEQADI